MTVHLQTGILLADADARNYLAKQWGKKSTSSDISLYTVANQDLIQTTIVPEAYPKKPLSLVVTAHMSDTVLLGMTANGIDSSVGEAALLADCLQIPGIKAVIGENTKGLDSYFGQMDKVFAKLNVSNWKQQMIYDGTGATNARELLEKAHPGARGNRDDYLSIEVDHAFPVQGVGSVILGTILSGTVEKGQKIKVVPSMQQGTVRSIQVNDVDERSASPGTHVGLAMKGILPKYLQRGTVITSAESDEVTETEELSFDLKAAAFGKPPNIGDRIHVMSGLYDTPGQVKAWGQSVTIETDKPVPYHNYCRVTVVDLNKKPFILGSKKL